MPRRKAQLARSLAAAAVVVGATPAAVTGVRVGMMYEGWHAPAYFGRGTQGLTVEAVLQSNGTHSMADMQQGMNLSQAISFYWHKEPAADSFYCIYRSRENSTDPPLLPDCPNITATLTRHAAMLTGAGVDFVFVDSTNAQHQGAVADLLQLRPLEVLLEEWAALRAAGVPTPRVVVHQNLQDPAGDLWKAVVALYNDPRYAGLFYRDDEAVAALEPVAAKAKAAKAAAGRRSPVGGPGSGTGKQVMFSTSNPDPGLVRAVEAAGDIVVAPTWALHSNYDKGELSFFSPCMDAQTGHFTSTVFSDPDRPCAQQHTTNAPIGAHGTSITVGPGYQLSYASLPFRAAGALGGLTLVRQFETVLRLLQQQRGTNSSSNASTAAAAFQLDHLLVGTFNEHIAQPQPNGFQGNDAAISMGMEGDAFARSLWVDTYGLRSRDLEPTKEDGGARWSLFESCMRVFRAQADNGTDCTAAGAPPALAAEPCCPTAAHLPQWVNLYSLAETQTGDSLLTSDQGERDALVNGGGWVERCAPLGGSAVFCNAASPPPADEWRRGPFAVLGDEGSVALASSGSEPEARKSSPTRQALYRCLVPSTAFHALSAQADCGDIDGAKAESRLGFTSLERNADTPRSLRVCRKTLSVPPRGRGRGRGEGAHEQYYHHLDAQCYPGDAQVSHLGFVY